jgi:hypothetical protein
MEDRSRLSEQSTRDDWNEYRRLVLKELERVGADIHATEGKVDRIKSEDLAQIKMDIALLKFQAAMWGAIGGTAFSVVGSFVMKMLLK